MIVVLRSIVVGLGGIALGLAAASAWVYFQQLLRTRSRLFCYLVAVRLGTAIAICYVEGTLVIRLSDSVLTWRTPTALVIYVLLVYGMGSIFRSYGTSDQHQVRAAVHEAAGRRGRE